MNAFYMDAEALQIKSIRIQWGSYKKILVFRYNTGTKRSESLRDGAQPLVFWKAP